MTTPTTTPKKRGRPKSTGPKLPAKSKAKQVEVAPKEKVKLPPNPFIHEILDLVEEQRSKAKKIEILKEYETPALKSIFIWNFDHSGVSLIPE